MYKLIGLLKRPEGMSLAEFHRWWLDEHAVLVKRFPGLKRYAINLASGADQRYDGMAEVWFESKEDFEKIFSTAEGQTARQSATSHAGEIVILFTQEHIIVEG
ncbi:MAG TPA: EthD family reductase [Candidatus Binatia bacterium]|nr:EthD family reductase [Candidatus Binatia bacterium]